MLYKLLQVYSTAFWFESLWTTQCRFSCILYVSNYMCKLYKYACQYNGRPTGTSVAEMLMSENKCWQFNYVKWKLVIQCEKDPGFTVCFIKKLLHNFLWKPFNIQYHNVYGITASPQESHIQRVVESQFDYSTCQKWQQQSMVELSYSTCTACVLYRWPLFSSKFIDWLAVVGF